MSKEKTIGEAFDNFVKDYEGPDNDVSSVYIYGNNYSGFEVVVTGTVFNYENTYTFTKHHNLNQEITELKTKVRSLQTKVRNLEKKKNEIEKAIQLLKRSEA